MPAAAVTGRMEAGAEVDLVVGGAARCKPVLGCNELGGRGLTVTAEGVAANDAAGGGSSTLR